MTRDLEFLLALDLVGGHSVDVDDRLLGHSVFLGYGIQVFKPFDPMDEVVFLICVCRLGRRLLYLDSRCFCRHGLLLDILLYRNHQDLVLLEPFGREGERRIRFIDLLDRHWRS